MFKLIELVVFCMVSCADKQLYISRMMQLDEEKQTELMYFIERLIDSRSQSPAESPVVHERKEIRNLRNEKKRLTTKIQEMNMRMESMFYEKGELASEIDELKLVNTDLQSELIKKSPIQSSSDSTIFHWELETQIQEKDKIIQRINNQLEETKKKHEEEIALLKDELDIANSKLLNLTVLQKSLDCYKKRYEKLASIKQQLSTAMRQNEEYLKKLNYYEKELKELEKQRDIYKKHRDQVKILQDKIMNLTHSIDMKDTQIHDMNYLLKQSEEQLLYYQDKLKVLEKELERYRCDSSPQTSEEHTADLRKMYDEELMKSLDVKYPDLSTDHLHSYSHQDMSKLEFDETFKMNKNMIENMHALEESMRMLSEDYLAMADKYQKSCEKYEIKIAHLIDEVDSFKAWKANQVDYKYEFDQIKIVNDWYVRELEGMLNAKEEIIKKYTEEKDKNTQQGNLISSLQTQLISLSSQIPILKQEIQDLTSHNHTQSSIESDSKESEKYISKIQDLKKDKIKLTSELSFLQSTLKQRELDLSLSQTETSKQLISLQEEHKNFLIQAREENNQAVSILVKQTQDALEQLQRERDDLVKELKEYRSKSLEGLQNIFLKSESEVYRKYRKARRVLAEREKEIEYLKRSKEDLKEAYEKAKKSLKAVMKTIGTETQRLNSRLLY